MQTKFNNYTNELNEIIGILNNFPPIFSISSKELRKYQSIISRKEFLQKRINNMLSKRANIIGNYNDKNRIWLESNMNCRRYYRVEQHAAYSRDKALYKVGFLYEKPIPPFITNLKNNISENFYQPLSNIISNFKIKTILHLKSISRKSPICKSLKKSKNFIANDLPQSLTNIAISGVKKCIISYRKISYSMNGSLKSFSRNISSTPSIRTLSYIMNRAKQEADMQENPFLYRIKINPNTYEYYNNAIAQNGYYGTGKPIIPSSIKVSVPSNNSNTLNNSPVSNLDLAL